jgi:hypothetical protein
LSGGQGERRNQASIPHGFLPQTHLEWSKYTP